MKKHGSRVNALQVEGLDTFYSASDDESIVKWSISQNKEVFTMKKGSSNNLGHTGPVNSISVCNGAVFSGGVDMTTRRWNTDTGKQIEIYTGFTKPVTSVLCYNSSVFSGSMDFALLEYKPKFLPSSSKTTKAGIKTTKNLQRSKTLQAIKSGNNEISNWTGAYTTLFSIAAVGGFFLLIGGVYALYKIWGRKEGTPVVRDTVPQHSTTYEFSNTATQVNSFMGLSKHAGLEIPSASIAQIEKVAKGGGGELYKAKVMDPVLSNSFGSVVIQKVVFSKNQSSEEAFFQEVGIMVALSQFPHFCLIIGYTLNPLSMILKYYPDGSLYEWIPKNEYGRKIMIKILTEIGKAVETMHNHSVAHCDLKSQNVLIEVKNSVPSCFLTDFGITQILSDKIIASKMFNIVTIRGLSTHYAAPEAFQNFRSKKYTSADFKKYDIYSYACVMKEVITRKMPWH